MTHYRTLGVPPSATDNEIRAAYWKLAIDNHPDRGGDGIKFRRITAAYAILKDSKLRQHYDAQLRLLGQACGVCDGKGKIAKQLSFTKIQYRPCAACGGSGQK